MTTSTTTTRQRISLYGYIDENTRYEVIGIDYDFDFLEALRKVKSVREKVKSDFLRTEVVDTTITVMHIE